MGKKRFLKHFNTGKKPEKETERYDVSKGICLMNLVCRKNKIETIEILSRK